MLIILVMEAGNEVKGLEQDRGGHRGMETPVDFEGPRPGQTAQRTGTDPSRHGHGGCPWVMPKTWAIGSATEAVPKQ